MILLMRSVGFRAAIAASASSDYSIVTNPKPRNSRVWGSYITDAFLTYINRGTSKEELLWKSSYSTNFCKGSSRPRVSTLWLSPETWRLFPGFTLLNKVPFKNGNSQDIIQNQRMWTNLFHFHGGTRASAPALDRLGGSPPLWSRGEWPLPLNQSWSSVFMAVPSIIQSSIGRNADVTACGSDILRSPGWRRWRKRKRSNRC